MWSRGLKYSVLIFFILYPVYSIGVLNDTELKYTGWELYLLNFDGAAYNFHFADC